MADVIYGWLLVAHQYARGLRALAQAASAAGGREGEALPSADVVCGTAQRPRARQSVPTSNGRPRPLIGGSGSAARTRQRPAA